MTYTVLSHTADTGVEAEAGSLAGLIEAMAKGMFATMTQLDQIDAQRLVTVEVEASTLVDLVVDTLSELLYRSEVEDLIFASFEVTVDGAFKATVNARGAPASEVELAGPPIKAVTYHDLVVRRSDEDWYCRVYFDV